MRLVTRPLNDGRPMRRGGSLVALLPAEDDRAADGGGSMRDRGTDGA